MTTIKVKFRVSSVEMREGTLFYQIIHNRVARQIHTGYKLYSSEWDSASSEVVLPSGVNEDRRRYLLSRKNALTDDITRLKRVIARIKRTNSTYTADNIVELYDKSTDNRGLISFSRNLINQLTQIGKKRTAETYMTTLNSFVRFRGEKDIPLEDVNSDLMVEYEAYLKSTGVCPNTSSFYMRNLRAIYNRAREKEFTQQRDPFKYVYTGIDKTVKRAVSIDVIRRIREIDLSMKPLMDYARDIFMFSFYTRGMSFIDMAFLKKKDLQNGILSYRRQKTNQQLFIKWEKPMREIVNKYDTSETPYLLPIIRDMGTDEWKQYKSASHLVNAKLKKLGEQFNLSVPLTSYVARHTWASVARGKNISISVISEAMGHNLENTTRIYLASLDTSIVDKANNLIIKSL